MKKSYKALSVLAVVCCCTLAFAVNRQQKKFDGTLRVDPASIAMAQSVVPQKTGLKVNALSADTPESVNEGMHTETVELFTPESTYGSSNNVEIDAANSIVNVDASDSRNALWAGMQEDGTFTWQSVAGASYVFSGQITSYGYDAIVYPCIFVQNANGLFDVYSNSVVVLNSDNDYSAEFNLSCDFADEGQILAVGFIEDNSSSYFYFTASNVHFYYTASVPVAEKWTEENNLEGLGIQDYMADNAYVVKCPDGVTTLGIYHDGAATYVTGINTTATEVSIPESIYLNGTYTTIGYFGTSDTMSWAGAPALTTLHLGAVNNAFADFSGSALTDIYISRSCYFDITNNLNNIYLHVPNKYDRSYYDSFGFKRVLIGEETPDYPVGEISSWVIAGDEEGVYYGVRIFNGSLYVVEVFTDKESVTLPVSTMFNNMNNYIRGFGLQENDWSEYVCKHAPNLKSITVPANYLNMWMDWTIQPFTELHMQGRMPETHNQLPDSMKVYIAGQEYYPTYETNNYWKTATLIPEGWDFEWMTIDVKRKGEFAQTYIEMTDADWSLGTYVKVTGTLNETDLGNIKNLTNLRRLDLSEAVFESLPNSFLNGASSLQSVVLPDNVKRIPQYAFANCGSLLKVQAEGVEAVDENAFYYCEQLKDFNISNVKSIGYRAFYYCRNFSPKAFSPELAYMGNYAFYNTSVFEVSLPESLREINSYVFSNCPSLMKVELPSTITSVGSYAFSNCRGLSEITLPEGVVSIGDNAFYNCTSLGELTIPSTVQSIGYNALSSCQALLTVKCKAVVPPVANSSFTSGMDMNHCTLYVAPFAIDAYRAAQSWSDFYIMKPLDEPVKNIYISRPMSFDLLSEDNAVLQDNPNMILDYGNNSVGQLSATGDGTLSAGIFKIFHRFERRDYRYGSDYRTTLINDAENMRADSVMCSIDFAKNYWHFISFQYDVKMEDIFGLNGTDFVIRQYNAEKRALGADNTSNWEDVPADGTLLAGKGYIIQAANNATDDNGNTRSAIVRFPSRNTTTKNNLFTNKNVIVPLEEYAAEFAHNRSWNLVGNPYPCYYNMHALMDDFTTPVTLWRGSSYQAYSPVDDDIILRPNEAFFVQRPLDAGQITFGAEGRMHYDAAVNSNATPGVKYAPALAADGNVRSVFNFTVEGCGSNDRARIVMNDEASMEYEINRDASKFFAETATCAELYVDGNVQYSICERPFANGEAQLGLRLAQKGEYTISLAGRYAEGWSVMLTDNATGVTVDITSAPYVFSSEAGEFPARFTVTFQRPESFVESVIGNSADENVQVVNIAGIVVFNGRLDDFKAAAQPGVYVVVSKDKTTKLVVK